MKKISKELMGASAVPLILSLLNQRDSYGYEITEAVRNLSGNIIHWKEGSLYPALKNLEKKKMVKSYWSSEPGKHRRRYYSLLDQGREALKVEKENWSLINAMFHKIWVLDEGLK